MLKVQKIEAVFNNFVVLGHGRLVELPLIVINNEENKECLRLEIVVGKQIL